MVYEKTKMKPFSHPLRMIVHHIMCLQREHEYSVYIILTCTYIQYTLQLNHLCAIYLDFPEHFPYKRMPPFPPSWFWHDTQGTRYSDSSNLWLLWIKRNFIHSIPIKYRHLMYLQDARCFLLYMKNINHFQYYKNKFTQ